MPRSSSRTSKLASTSAREHDAHPTGLRISAPAETSESERQRINRDAVFRVLDAQRAAASRFIALIERGAGDADEIVASDRSVVQRALDLPVEEESEG